MQQFINIRKDKLHEESLAILCYVYELNFIAGIIQ